MQKYFDNSISKEELELLLQKLSGNEDMHGFSEVLKTHWESASLNSQGLASGSWDEKFHAMMEEAKQAVPVIAISKAKKIKTIYRFAAAASIAALLLSAGYFIFFARGSKKETHTEIGKSSTNDIAAPVGSKTTLKLSNGTIVILDSLENGRIAQQGNVNVQKINSGQLAYTTLKEEPAEIVYNTLSTAKGGQTRIVLADGTKVWLNASSSLRFPVAFSGGKREVELMGEGYFEVAKNPAMPFYVKSKDLQVRVLGTHFDVMAYEDEKVIKTTLLEGSVKIIRNKSVKVLKPGQEASIQKSGDAISVSSDIDTDDAIAWKNGFFQFNRLDMKGIMRQVSRWYDVEVQFAPDVNTSRTFSAVVSRSSNLSAVMKIMEQANIHFKIKGKIITITQ